MTITVKDTFGQMVQEFKDNIVSSNYSPTSNSCDSFGNNEYPSRSSFENSKLFFGLYGLAADKHIAEQLKLPEKEIELLTTNLSDNREEFADYKRSTNSFNKDVPSRVINNLDDGNNLTREQLIKKIIHEENIIPVTANTQALQKDKELRERNNFIPMYSLFKFKDIIDKDNEIKANTGLDYNDRLAIVAEHKQKFNDIKRNSEENKTYRQIQNERAQGLSVLNLNPEVNNGEETIKRDVKKRENATSEDSIINELNSTIIIHPQEQQKIQEHNDKLTKDILDINNKNNDISKPKIRINLSWKNNQDKDKKDQRGYASDDFINNINDVLNTNKSYEDKQENKIDENISEDQLTEDDGRQIVYDFTDEDEQDLGQESKSQIQSIKPKIQINNHTQPKQSEQTKENEENEEINSYDIANKLQRFDFNLIRQNLAQVREKANKEDENSEDKIQILNKQDDNEDNKDTIQTIDNKPEEDEENIDYSFVEPQDKISNSNEENNEDTQDPDIQNFSNYLNNLMSGKNIQDKPRMDPKDSSYPIQIIQPEPNKINKDDNQLSDIKPDGNNDLDYLYSISGSDEGTKEAWVDAYNAELKKRASNRNPKILSGQFAILNGQVNIISDFVYKNSKKNKKTNVLDFFKNKWI